MPERRASRAAVLACAFLLPAVILLSCAKKAEDTRGLWPGIYRAAGDAGSGIAEMSVDGADGKEIGFFLRLVKDNGFTREISGKAAYSGRKAAFSREGVDLSFSLGEDQSILIEDGASKTLAGDGFGPSLRLARETVKRGGGAEELPGPGGAASGPGASEPPGKAFKFGYYLPEGADPNAQALPESFSFLFFDKESMTVRLLSMFEGNMTEGKLLGAFTAGDEALSLKAKDEKTGKAKNLEWKRSGSDVVVTDSGQRYFFWKDNLQK